MKSRGPDETGVAGSGSELDRASGALRGLALGDALGMPFEGLAREHVGAALAAPWPALRPGRGLLAGTVTDDTEQALLLAALLVDGGPAVEARALADALLAWEDRLRERGRVDLLGPSTRRALADVKAGADPTTTGRAGTTNGSTMRVAPVGIAVPPEPLGHLLEAVVAAGRPTHDTSVAQAASAAVATAVSVGVDGGDVAAALALGCRAAGELDPRLGAELAGVLARRVPPEDVPWTTGLPAWELVLGAFAAAAATPEDAWAAAARAVRLGGDTDTVAAVTGAVVGACTGTAGLPSDAVGLVEHVNGLDLVSAARGLVEVRHRSAPSR